MTSIRANGTNQADWPTGIYISAGMCTMLAAAAAAAAAITTTRRPVHQPTSLVASKTRQYFPRASYLPNQFSTSPAPAYRAAAAATVIDGLRAIQ